VLSILLTLAVAAIILVVILGIGALVLVKLGVITRYAFKEELPERGDYELDQSHEAGEE
jgi:TRAP-type C4-dicarboxylate transport system permease small subunit